MHIATWTHYIEETLVSRIYGITNTIGDDGDSGDVVDSINDAEDSYDTNSEISVQPDIKLDLCDVTTPSMESDFTGNCTSGIDTLVIGDTLYFKISTDNTLVDSLSLAVFQYKIEDLDDSNGAIYTGAATLVASSADNKTKYYSWVANISLEDGEFPDPDMITNAFTLTLITVVDITMVSSRRSLQELVENRESTTSSSSFEVPLEVEIQLVTQEYYDAHLLGSQIEYEEVEKTGLGIGIILGIFFGALALISLIVLLIVCLRRKKENKEAVHQKGATTVTERSDVDVADKDNKIEV